MECIPHPVNNALTDAQAITSDGYMRTSPLHACNQLMAFFLFAATGCVAPRYKHTPPANINREEMKEDLHILRNILEKYHPSLHAYTDKPTLDAVFLKSLEQVPASLPEPTFAYQIIAPYLAAIRCGHTSVSLSNDYKKYLKRNPPPSFPLLLKFLGDTIVVTRNLHQSDSIFKKGTIIRSIDGMNAAALKNRLFASFPMDGFAQNVNLARLNNNFPFYYRMVVGIDTSFSIQYLNRNQIVETIEVPAYQTYPIISKTRGQGQQIKPSISAANASRGLQIDSVSAIAYMRLASFEHPLKTHVFIKNSFSAIRNNGIQHLIIDLRSNGGGIIDNEVYLARHIKKEPFRVADSAVAKSRRFNGYARYFQHEWVNALIMKCMTRADSNGMFHMSGLWEKRSFQPIQKRLFPGRVYVLTGGMTFSAASLFCITVKGQENVLLIGEETGGGGYANNGLLIPDITLPNSRLKVRMPLFRLVPDKSASNDGRGVVPDILVSASTLSIQGGFDPVLVKTLTIINKLNAEKKNSANKE